MTLRRVGDRKVISVACEVVDTEVMLIAPCFGLDTSLRLCDELIPEVLWCAVIVSFACPSFGALWPKTYLRKAKVFFVSIYCLSMTSASMFLFRWMRTRESVCLCMSCSSRSRWIRFMSEFTCSCWCFRSFSSSLSTLALMDC